ncbi:putative endopeptidase [Kytococcus aerolatus]|uniref:Putative endopeptidase n=1 Tax=Kytococcus aerolatus TaxID=592308 RepID=A0A212TAS2_9MICO|nr:M13-type metalloendopeptidase [Kytococcus aerolatus]SNC63112.1 putative endopeptidase [Kytococcus aerolatus]
MTTLGLSLDHRDLSVRPQDDLFLHANGTWRATHEIPADRSRYGTFDALRERAEEDVRVLVEEAAEQAADEGADENAQRVGDLYRSFMDTEAVEAAGTDALAEDLQRVRSVQDATGLARALGELQARGVEGLVHPFVDNDNEFPDRYSVYLHQGGLGLPDESYYREEQHAEVLSAYQEHVARLAVLGGIVDEAGAEGFAQRVVDLETRIAGLHWDAVRARDAVASFTPWTREELGARTAGLHLEEWAAALGLPDDGLERVIARQHDFLSRVGGLVEGFDAVELDTWRDWLAWRVLGSRAPYLMQAIVEENFAFHGRTLTGAPELRDRWKRGVAFVEGAAGELVGQLYVAKHFPPSHKAAMEELVANVVEAYRQCFESLDWMGPETRERALEKLGTFRPKIGYPERWKDYSALEVDPGDLLGNVRRSALVETARELAKIGKEVDREEWFMPPQMVNAYYNPGMNEIVFPAAILQPPFFDAEADPAANYGGIGGVIGHEIGHGFDDQGSRYSGEGKLEDWWTAEDRERFDALAQQLVEQFSALEPIDAPGHTVNGALTVGENIGDLGGLAIGYAAYQLSLGDQEAPELEGLTGAQRFFLSWAQIWCGSAREAEAKRLLVVDPHAPMDARANVARNLDAFHEAFGTQPGDGMWLDEADRVRIF